MKISVLPALVGLTVLSAPAHAACLSDITKFQDRMEAYWQSANYQATDQQQPAKNEDQTTDQSLEGRTSETGPRTTEDAKKEDAKEQAQADPKAAEEATETVKEEVVDKGPEIEEDGGTTKYAEGGPAGPTENWFGKPPRKDEILSKLDEAREYAAAGNEQACSDALGAAQKLASN